MLTKFDFEQYKLFKNNGDLNGMQMSKFILSDTYKILLNESNFLTPAASIPERIYCALKSISAVVTCYECNNKTQFVNFKKGYRLYCSTLCSNKSKIKIDCVKKAKMAKYGDGNYNNPEKMKETCMATYGHEYHVQSDDFIACQKNSNLQKYGVDSYIKTDEFREKAKITKKLRYGDENYNNREKAKNTSFKNHGVDNPTKKHISAKSLTTLLDSELFIDFVTNKSRAECARQLLVDGTTISNYVAKYNCADKLDMHKKSQWETTIAGYLDELNINYDQNTRKIIYPQELDFYLPDYNIAIELNGNYWHSELAGGKDKNYHYYKWLACRDKNIDLYSYFEDELIDNLDVIKSKLTYLVKNNYRVIGARKCAIKDVKYQDESTFLNINHIQGSSTSRTKSIGAYYNNNLVAVFSWSQRKQYLEITRFACDTNASYPGLFSKMMKHMITELDYYGNVVSFSNNGHSNGGVYKASGFVIDKILGPAYWYTQDYLVRENRQGYMKSKIATKFKYDMTDKTEWQAMQELGYDRIWDSGKIKWSKTV